METFDAQEQSRHGDKFHLAEYNALVKGRIDEALAMMDSPAIDIGNFIARIGAILGNYPTDLLVQQIETSGKLSQFVNTMTAYGRAELQKYAKKTCPQGAEVDAIASMLDNCDFLYFGMLLAKDAQTAFHCIDALFLSRRILESRVFGDIDNNQQIALTNAAIRHDLGKLRVPNIVLCNPLTRDQQPAVWAGNLADPKRKRPIRMSFQLTHEEQTEFLDLVEGRDFNAAKVESFARLFKEKRGDFREVPIRYILSVCRYILKTGQFPDSMRKNLDGTSSEVGERITGLLRGQEEALRYVDAIFALFGIDGWNTSFMETLAIHEFGSACELSRREPIESLPWESVVRLAGTHHGYQYTQRRLEAERPTEDNERLIRIFRNETPGHDEGMLTFLLRMIDVIAALGQSGRAYRSNAMPVDRIKGILESEAKTGKLDMDMVKKAEDTLLKVDSAAGEPDVFTLVAENSARLRGAAADSKTRN